MLSVWQKSILYNISLKIILVFKALLYTVARSKNKATDSTVNFKN